MTVTNKPNSVGLSAEDWITFSLDIAVTKIQGVHKDGRFFSGEHNIVLGSIDWLEFSKTRSHIPKVDGDNSMVTKEIVKQFYEDKNIDIIYGEENANDIDLFLVLNQEVEQLDLRLAKLQNKISKQYPKHNIEIMYTTKDFFDRDSVSPGSITYPRG